MSRSALLALVVVAFGIGFAIYAVRQPSPPEGEVVTAPPGATLLEGLGNYHFPISTRNPEAQRWFNQGLMLTYGFNHDAAERSFLKAVEKDPECAMCWWGAALVLGPHVNAPMDPANGGKAQMRAKKAQELASAASPREQAYITALAKRYAEAAPEDQGRLEQAYAEAMAEVMAQFPDELDAATMHAEALMNQQPWDFYDQQRNPKRNTERIVAILEEVMRRNPEHPGALHLYIHAVEGSRDPQRGVAAADRLRDLIPGSGHLVHMPAHIYTRVGRYHDAVLANKKGIEADDAYLAACRPAPGIYPLGYVPHNHHFLWWAASMEGDSETALAAAAETARRAWIPEMIRIPEFAFLQDFWVTPLKAQVQFGRWDDIVKTEKPGDDLPYAQAIWHFAQGMAAVRQQRIADAEQHQAALAQAAADPQMEQLLVGPKHPLSGTLRVAERVLAGELALAQRRPEAGIEALQQAVATEDSLAYFEPPLWYQPARQNLGAALLAAGRAQEAEAVYRQDLEHHPGNGWSLFGLTASLRAQSKTAEAEQVERQFQAAWKYADVSIQPLLLSIRE